MPNTIRIKNYTYTLPPIPTDVDIDGSEHKKADQYWRRLKEPNFKKLYTTKAQQKAALDKWIEKILDYRINGYWFMNNGEPEYITGDHFFFLNYVQVDLGTYPEFRKAQRDYYYFLDLCDKDEKCHGSIKGKYRREGATTMVLAKFANNATLTERRWYGIQSKTYEDAKKVCYLPIVDMVMRLPKYFRPLMASNDRPQQELLFRKPSSRLSAKKQSDDDEMYFDEDLSDGLNTKIDYKATDEAAYDGKKLYAYLMDEFSKWKEANPMDTYTTVKRSLTLGGNKIIYGKTFVLSTSDEKDSKSFMEWKSLWDTSDISKRAEDGKTISGLYRYPIFAYEGLEGFIDKYGNCDEDAAKKHLMMERKKLEDAGDQQRLIAEIRQMPMSEEEMFGMGGGESPLSPKNILRIGRRKREIELALNKKYTQGNLVWQENARDTRVIWQPCKDGKWLIGDELHPLVPNQFRILSNGQYAPPQQVEHIMGIDPYDYQETQKKGSRGASHVKKQFDYFEQGKSNVICSEYYSRPDDPYEFYEDMIKQAVYFGGKVLPERKNYGIFKYFKERGYEKFLMARPIGIKNNQTTIKDNLAGLPAHANVTSAGFELIEAYLSQQYDEGVDYLKDFLFERTLEDILMFNPKDTHKYDLTMSLIYTMFAGNELKKQITFRESSLSEAMGLLVPKVE